MGAFSPAALPQALYAGKSEGRDIQHEHQDSQGSVYKVCLLDFHCYSDYKLRFSHTAELAACIFNYSKLSFHTLKDYLCLSRLITRYYKNPFCYSLSVMNICLFASISYITLTSALVLQPHCIYIPLHKLNFTTFFVMYCIYTVPPFLKGLFYNLCLC